MCILFKLFSPNKLLGKLTSIFLSSNNDKNMRKNKKKAKIALLNYNVDTV